MLVTFSQKHRLDMQRNSQMTIQTLVLAACVALSAQAQSIQEPIFFFAQSAPPAPPAPPAPMQDMLRLMSIDGSYLGVGVRDIDAESKKSLNLKEERGAEITSVEPGAPADKAGLKQGDVVLEYNGQRIEGTQQFIRMVRETPAGREVKIVVSRSGSPFTVSAQPGEAKHRLQAGPRIITMPTFSGPGPQGRPFTIDVPRAMMSWTSGTLGIEAETLDSQLAEFFGVKQGVLVRSVAKSTPAEKAGLRAGDVIVKVDETKVSAPREVTSAIRSHGNNKKPLPFTIVREKKETTLSVSLEAPTPEPAEAPRPRSRSVQNKFF
jgi:serine protease Do